MSAKKMLREDAVAGTLNPSSPKIQELSKELARIAGLRLRAPRKGDTAHTRAGVLRSVLPPEFFHWCKCPKHNTWLQPEFVPYPHWACFAATPHFKEGHEQPEGYHCCDYKRAAKMRTQIERRIFAVARFLQEHA